ncbi:MAG: hypothetical protein U5P41_14245 [Gammaproteobacteria bacterium]|nr:hypothetical protein [Gammaproteobacteria bacterium]
MEKRAQNKRRCSMNKNCKSGVPLIVVMFLSLSVSAQAGGGMSEEQMQQMMKMQECMAKVDQSRLEALTAEADGMNKEIRALCAAGKRDQAQNVAIDYGKEISASPAPCRKQKCGEMAKGMQMPMMADLEKNYADRHVCDDM